MADTPEAALAAALQAELATERGFIHTTPDKLARDLLNLSLLVPLPPCEHEAEVLEIIDLQHKWADANGDAMADGDEYEAKIVRLRAAGDALAKAVGAMRDAVDPDDASEGTFWLAVDEAIAALASWKEATDD